MNKIYKVVWNKARNCYVVGSEFISSHSTGKSSRGTSRGAILRCLVLSALVAGAAALPLAGGVQAAELTPQTVGQAQYIVFGTGSNNTTVGSTTTVDGHIYVCQSYEGLSSGSTRFWVRQGYSIVGNDGGMLKVAHNSEYNSGTSDDGLLISYTQDLAGGDTSSVYTNNVQSGELTANVYGAATTSPTAYKVALYGGSGGKEEVRLGKDANKVSIVDNTAEVTYDSSTGKYKLAGDEEGTIDASYVYSITANSSNNLNVTTAKTYVFTTKDDDGNTVVYTGEVYGGNGERLVTGTDGKGNMYTAWGTPVDASQVTAEEISIEKYVQNYNELSDRIHKNFQQLPKNMTASGSANNGTISVMTEGGEAIDGLTITSTGGNNGNDTQLTVKDVNNNSFSLDTGSKVKVTSGGTGTAKETTKISVNGTEYTITDTDTTYKFEAGTNVTSVGATNNKNTENTVKVNVDNLGYKVNGTQSTSTVALKDGLDFKNGNEYVTVADGTNGTITISGNESKIKEAAQNAIDVKAGTNIDSVGIETKDGVKTFTVNAKDTTYNKGDAITINDKDSNKISVNYGDGIKLVDDKLTVDTEKVAQTTNLSYKSNSDTTVKTTTLSTGLTFNGTGSVSVTTEDGGVVNISATDNDTTYKAGTNVSITQNESGENVISATHNALKDAKLGTGDDAKKLTITGNDNDRVTVDLSSIDTDTKYTKGTATEIGDSNAINVLHDSTLSVNDDNQLGVNTSNVNLSYKANDAATANTVSLSKGLNFKNGDNVTITTGENGVVTIGATDTKLDSVTLEGKTLKVKDTSGVEKTQDLSSIDTNTTYTVASTTSDKGIIDITVTPYDGTTAGTATKISSIATQKYVDDTENYVTDGKLDTATGTITLNRRIGDAVTINGLEGYVKGLDTYVTDAKYDSSTKKLTITQNATDDQYKKYEIDLSSVTSGLSSSDYSLTNGTADILKQNGTNKTSVKGYKVDRAGTVSVTVSDRNGDGKDETVNIGGIAVVYSTDVCYNSGKENNLMSTNSAGTRFSREVNGGDTSGNTDVKATSSITLGENAYVYLEGGNKANAILFGNENHTGGIAIGENAKALNDSITISTNSYKGKMGNVDLSTYNAVGKNAWDNGALGMGATTIGSNSYTAGSLTTNIGTYNISTSDYNNGTNSSYYYDDEGKFHFGTTAAQNFGSTILGTMNSIESYGTKDYRSGVANSIVGLANKTSNSNGSLIFGAGNEITNSIGDISTAATGSSVADAAEAYRDEVELNKSGGAVLAIGGGNKAGYVKHSQLMGVNNKVTGTDGDVSEFVMVDGYENTVTNSDNVTVIGSTNTVQGNSNKIYGDKHNVTGKDNVIIGSNDTLTDTTVDGATILGHNANATAAGGVALGEGSIADRALGTFGTATKAAFNDDDSTGAAWVSTAGAVSVGTDGTTRQITNVAAGSEDTDAVNVAQLKRAKTKVEKGTNIASVVETKGDDGNSIYTVNADGTTVSKGDDNVIVTPGTKDANNVTDYSVKLANILNIGDSNKVTINGTEGTVNGLTNKTWDENYQITSGQAATEDQLQAVKSSIENTSYKGWNVSTNKNTKNVDQVTKDVASNGTVDFSNSDNNINITQSGTDIDLKLADDVTINSSLKVADTALTVDKNKVMSQIGGSELQVIGDQISLKNRNGNLIVSQFGVTMDGYNQNRIKLDMNGTTFTDASQKQTNIKGDQVSIGNTIKADGTNGVITGLTNKEIDYTGFATTGKAATEEQLSAMADKIDKAAYKGWKVSANGADGVDVTSGATVDFSNTDNNIVIEQDGTNIKTKLADDVTINDSLTVGDELTVKDGNVVINGKTYVQGATTITDGTAGISVNNGKVAITDGTDLISMTGDGVIINGLNVATKDAEGNSQIHNVAAGTELTDAVNVSQLKEAAAAAKTVVTEGTNVDVKTTVHNGEGEDGHTEYTVNAYDTQVAKGDSNIVVDGGSLDENNVRNYSVKLADDVKINNSLTVGDNNTFVADAEKGSVLVNGTMYVEGATTINDGDGAAIRVAGGKVYATAGTDYVAMTGDGVKINGITVATKDAEGNSQIHNVAAGTELTDAVNVSQLEKAAAAAKTEVKAKDGEKNIKVEEASTKGADGQTIYEVSMSRDLDVDSVTAGDNVFNKTGLTIGKEGSTQIVINQNTISMGGQQIHNVAAGTAQTDAVNVSQLEKAVAEGDSHIKAGSYSIGDDNSVSMNIVKTVDGQEQVTGTVTISDVAKASDVGDISKFHDDVKNEDGSKTTVVDAINNIDTRVDKVEGDITTINTKIDNVETIAKKHTTVSKTDENITITESENTDGGKNYAIGLAKDITVDSVTAGDTVVNTAGIKVGDTTSLTKDAVTIGTSSLTTDTLKVGGKTYIDGSGINANDQKITNVADGEVSETSTDAINGSQLYVRDQAIINNSYNIQNIYGNMNKLDSRIKRVGAGAAALAALHPLDFDPDAKWDFAAGYGNYRGANAVAIGTFYRPNEDTMFNVGGSFGGGENMVNAGVSLKIGAGSSHVNTSKVAMAKEIKDMRAELESLKSALLDANAGRKIDTSKLQLFPDVPENHWAYEYVATLAGNGIIEGYPDGNFSGDRPMTRYEFAAMLYRAMLNGATLSDKVLAEFAPELERFTVDTIYKDKDGNPTVERVRTVKNAK